MIAEPVADHGKSVDTLVDFVRGHRRLFVLTGAGCSTDSGIPDYRDRRGEWKRRQPVSYQAFIGSASVRRRYWLRSLVGWRHFARARPNSAHTALAALEAAGFVHQLVTQNVDRLHQRAGSRKVIDLHGRLDEVHCLDCGHAWPRGEFQRQLETLNPAFIDLTGDTAPDGDAYLEAADLERFEVPTCPRCGGLVKPSVVFFGESVPTPTVERAFAGLAQADAVLVVGSSLMVYSGYRFCREAHAQGKPVAAINLGRTRADGELAFKLEATCAQALGELVSALCA